MTNNMNNETEQLITRLRTAVAHMPDHQKNRLQGKLIIDALAEIQLLSKKITEAPDVGVTPLTDTDIMNTTSNRSQTTMNNPATPACSRSFADCDCENKPNEKMKKRKESNRIATSGSRPTTGKIKPTIPNLTPKR